MNQPVIAPSTALMTGAEAGTYIPDSNGVASIVAR